MKLFELILYLSDPKLYVKFGWGGGLKRKLSTDIFYAHLHRLTLIGGCTMGNNFTVYFQYQSKVTSSAFK